MKHYFLKWLHGISGADPQNIPRTLKNFGFSSGGRLENYNTDAVINELQYGHHVLIGGYDTRKKHKTKILGIKINTYSTYSGGHRWLAHGLLKRVRKVSQYDRNNKLINEWDEVVWYPLCNFGWDGYGDGYYLSGAFDVNKQPAYKRNGPHMRSSSEKDSYENEGTPNNFQYKMTAVLGIRK